MQLGDWTFVLGVPDTKSGFKRARENAEYCVPYEDWPDYEQRFVRLLKRYVDPLEQAGLKIIRDASVTQFVRQLQGTRGVLLFSHCNRRLGTIEFSNGMTPYADVAASIDPKFCGVVDVSVCAPDGIHEAIQARAPHCAVRSTMGKVRPAQWLPFHAFCLTEFCAGSRSYAQAILAATRLFAPKQDTASSPDTE